MSYTSYNIKEIHSGILHKVGGRVKSWHKRWVILKSDYTLQYFKEPSKGALGTISLRDSEFDIRSGERRDYNWPRHCDIDCSLVITTRGRVYYMFAESKEEAEDWIKHIQTSKENLHIKEGKGGKNRIPEFLKLYVYNYRYHFSYMYKLIIIIMIIMVFSQLPMHALNG